MFSQLIWWISLTDFLILNYLASLWQAPLGRGRFLFSYVVELNSMKILHLCSRGISLKSSFLVGSPSSFYIRVMLASEHELKMSTFIFWKSLCRIGIMVLLKFRSQQDHLLSTPPWPSWVLPCPHPLSTPTLFLNRLTFLKTPVFSKETSYPHPKQKLVTFALSLGLTLYSHLTPAPSPLGWTHREVSFPPVQVQVQLQVEL